MTFKTGTAIAACALSAVLLSSSAGFAETVTLKGDLTASAETPPNSSKGTGTFTGTYDTATKTISYSVTYSDLTGPATAAHFHGPAAIGKSAGVELPIKGELASPIKGSATLTADQEKNLMDGETYFNIHTAANKNGELRAQVMKFK